MKESSSSEDKEKVKVEVLSLPCEDLTLPFYQTRGQATLVKREKKRKSGACTTAVKGRSFPMQRVPPSSLVLLAVVDMCNCL
jgi:hypothetical protein